MADQNVYTYIKQLFELYYPPIKVKNILEVETIKDKITCTVISNQSLSYQCTIDLNTRVFVSIPLVSLYNASK